MNIEYHIKERKVIIDGRLFDTYGISAVDDDTEKIKSDFPDVSLNQTLVIRLVKLLNSEKVELCHFNDVVLDELNK